MDGALQVFSTIGSEEAAEELSAALVGEGLAACVQVVGPIASTYRWEGRVERATEWLLLAKTTRAGFPRLRDAILARHPYDVPEVVAVPIEEGNSAYLDWIGDGVAGP